MSIIELRQTSENDWKARYDGNYGVYTIKITRKEGKTVRFSCSCPSDYYPCKHIAMIEKAIAEKIAGGEKTEKRGGAQVADLIKDISGDELRKFIAAQAEYNPELRNAVFLEFTAKIKNKNSNKYSPVIRELLKSVSESDYYGDDYYSEEPTQIEGMDQWLDKAEDYLRRKQYDEAIFICKACIEEFSSWFYKNKSDEIWFSEEYFSAPFDIIEKAAKHADKKELFNYCLLEMKKKQYEDTGFYRHFNDLLGKLAPRVDPDAFLDMQDKLLADVRDKSSYAAEVILRRKINLFRDLGNEKKALEIIEENIQLPNFRMMLVKDRIKQRDFPEAKKLINDFIAAGEYSHTNEWYELLLDIAQKENDIPAVQKLAYGFLEERFDKKHFEIYKSAFGTDKWPAALEKLFLRYDSDSNRFHDFSDSAAQLLIEEKETERLLRYVEQHLLLDSLAEYYKFFADAYPEETVELFKTALEQYAEENVGRTHYEYILSALRKMSRVKGGKKAALVLVSDFKTRYKNRKAMIETLNQFR